jgi:putative SOS response-associated peptidase YedK
VELWHWFKQRSLPHSLTVIPDPADFGRWLDRDQQDPKGVVDLLKPFPAEKMQLVPVSTLVDSPRNEKPECVQPLIEGPRSTAEI